MESADQFSFRVATIQQRCLPSLCAQLFLQYHWSPIGLCRRAMFSGKFFTSFVEFQRIVSVNFFRIPVSLQELFQASLCFLGSFCFARIRLDPLSGQVPHHHCISMIVSRFTTFTGNSVICCCQVTKLFSTKYGSATASSARGWWKFRPLADLAISVLREISFNTVFAQIRTSRRI